MVKSQPRQFVPATLIPGFIGLAAQQGANLNAVLQRAGLSPAMLADPNSVLSVQQLNDLVVGLRDELKDPAFGLHFGELLRLEQLQVVGSLIATAPTARVALEQFIRFKDLLHPWGTITLDEDQGKGILTYDPGHELPPDTAHYYAELYFSGAINIARQMLKHQTEIRVVDVHFMAEPPDYLEEYQRIFQAPVTFSSSINAIRFDSSFLDLPLPTSLPEYHEQMAHKAARRLSEMPDRDSWTSRISQYLREQIGIRVLSMEDVAKHLNITPRTLQRRLRQENTTYAAIRDEVRFEAAQRYLKDPDMDMDTIAASLGFSEPANFYPAFKRWSGMSPGEFRRRHSSGS